MRSKTSRAARPTREARSRSGRTRRSSAARSAHTAAICAATMGQRASPPKRPAITASGTKAYVTGLSSAPVAKLSPTWTQSMPMRFCRTAPDLKPRRWNRTASATKKAKVGTSSATRNGARQRAGSKAATTSTSATAMGMATRRIPTMRPKSRDTSWRWISSNPAGRGGISASSRAASIPLPPARRPIERGDRDAEARAGVGAAHLRLVEPIVRVEDVERGGDAALEPAPRRRRRLARDPRLVIGEAQPLGRHRDVASRVGDLLGDPHALRLGGGARLRDLALGLARPPVAQPAIVERPGEVGGEPPPLVLAGGEGHVLGEGRRAER